MTSDAEKDLFWAALELPTLEREAFLAEHCPDIAMRDRVRALLDSHEAADEFMSSPTVITSPRTPADTEVSVGATIGPYVLESRLGEGGFGHVYLARQQSPVVRTVALKVLRADMDSRAIVARFEAERQALAVMDHPNVARVFDGGKTTSGRPYFVMEYVRGEPITTYCARKSLSVRQRLALFEQVCLAVQHAHHKGIIHRDLKPSNVLVTEVDSQPVPKVIDFGIAKAIGAQAVGSAMMTMEGHLMGTPAYMSPEQAQGAAVMDTRSDVYTLGVLLYEVLTGLLPFDPVRFEGTPLNSVVKIICEEAPAKPSTRLLRTEGHDATPNRALASRLRGDLDWIVMRAMEKDPGRRYQTASGLGDDIRRYLRDEAVVAGPPSGIYRLRKFALRHRGEFLAASLIIVALVGGLVSSLIFAARVDHQAKLTEMELEKSKAFAGFVGGMLSGLDPAVARGEDTTVLRQMLTDAEERLVRDPPGSESAEAEMHELLGTAFYLIADYDKAQQQFEQALVHASASDGPKSVLSLRIRHALGQAYVESSQFEAARQELSDVYNARVETLGPDHEDTVAALFDLGALDRITGDYERARDTFEQVIARREVILGDRHEDTMSARNSLATVLDTLGEHKEAAELFRQVIAYQLDVLGPEHPHTLATQNNYADTLLNLGDTEGGVALLTELLKTKRRVLEPDHPSLVVALNNLASLQQRLGNTEQAEAMLTEAVDIAQRTSGPHDRRTLILTSNLAGLMVTTGRAAEARDRLKAAIPICEEVFDPNHPLTLAMLSHLGGAELELGEVGRAMTTAESIIKRAQTSLPPDHPSQGRYRRLLGKALLEAGELDSAETVLLAAYEMHQLPAYPDESDMAKTASVLADLYEAQGKPDDAATWREKAGDE